jgi:hypothetical protein
MGRIGTSTVEYFIGASGEAKTLAFTDRDSPGPSRRELLALRVQLEGGIGRRL